MTLEEAACGGSAPAQPPPLEESAAAAATRAESVFARAVHMMDAQLRADKARREAALRAARERGLDAGESAPRRPSSRSSSRRWRRNPYIHARVLLRETALPLRDIVDITGLDIYKVVEMKLKMREEAGTEAREVAAVRARLRPEAPQIRRRRLPASPPPGLPARCRPT